MKKSFKRAGVAVLSMAMLLSMGAVGAMTANAAYSDKWTVTADTNLPTATFAVYQVADGGHKPTSQFTSVLADKAAVEALNSSTVAGIADKLQGKATTVYNSYSAVDLGTEVDLENGYYLVIVDTKKGDFIAQPILVQVNNDTPADASVKVTQITLDKSITAADGATTYSNSESADIHVGSVVDYQITTVIPKYSKTDNAGNAITALDTHFQIKDVPTNVKYNTGTLVVTYGASNTEVAASNYTLTEEDNGFKIVFNDSFVLNDTYAGETLKLAYKSTVQAGAYTETTANPNTATLTFDTDYIQDGTPSPSTKDDKCNVYAASLDVKKINASTNAAIPNVEFTLQDSSDTYIKIDGTVGTSTDKLVTDSSGEIHITGLGVGTYTLTEVAVPDGFVEPASKVMTVTISPATSGTFNGTYTIASTNSIASVSGKEVTVKNTPVGALPGTGGMGTVLFTVGGAAIVLLAGALFVVYMRKRKADEE